MERGHHRLGNHQEPRHGAHGARVQARQRLLQPPAAEIDGDRHDDADHLQQQQHPTGNRTRVDRVAKGNQHRGQRDSIECQRNGRRQGAPCDHRGGNRHEHQQRFVEQDRRVGRQPPQRHQRNEQRCGNRSTVSALRRSGILPGPPGEQPGGQRQDAQEQAGKTGAVLHHVLLQHPPGGTQLLGDVLELRGRRAELPYRRSFQHHPVRADALLPRRRRARARHRRALAGPPRGRARAKRCRATPADDRSCLAASPRSIARARGPARERVAPPETTGAPATSGPPTRARCHRARGAGRSTRARRQWSSPRDATPSVHDPGRSGRPPRPSPSRPRRRHRIPPPAPWFAPPARATARTARDGPAPRAASPRWRWPA